MIIIQILTLNDLQRSSGVKTTAGGQLNNQSNPYIGRVGIFRSCCAELNLEENLVIDHLMALESLSKKRHEIAL